MGGGISVFLCSNVGGPAGVQSCPIDPAPGEVEGIITVDDVIGPTLQGIEAGAFEELLDAIRAGKTDVNIHITKWPSARSAARSRTTTTMGNTNAQRVATRSAWCPGTGVRHERFPLCSLPGRPFPFPFSFSAPQRALLRDPGLVRCTRLAGVAGKMSGTAGPVPLTNLSRP
jgi:hypothetical protein